MIDLGATIVPKSDQLNSDDLIAGPRTIRITRVTAEPSSSEQPVAIYYEGDEGKPYKPCKSMRRVLAHVWSLDASSFVGRSLTLYRDPKVVFGGLAVGGIRISHMSDISSDVTMALTATKASRKPFTVKPLVTKQPSQEPSSGEAADPRGQAAGWVSRTELAIAGAADRTALATLQTKRSDALAKVRAAYPDLAAKVDAAITARLASFDDAADDDADAFGLRPIPPAAD